MHVEDAWSYLGYDEHKDEEVIRTHPCYSMCKNMFQFSRFHMLTSGCIDGVIFWWKVALLDMSNLNDQSSVRPVSANLIDRIGKATILVN
jgi:hypothetical protein